MSVSKNASVSTQTDTLKHVSEAQNNSSKKEVKSISMETEPCDLEKCIINDDAPTTPTFIDDDNQEEEDDALRQNHELQRRLNPKTAEDFDQLQAELIQWKHRQERKILMTARNAAHKKELVNKLLDQESKLLRKIGTLKSAACETWKMERLEKIMEELAQSKEWSVDGGLNVTVDTPEIVHAREMKNVFAELKKDVDSGKLPLFERSNSFYNAIV